MTLIHLMIIGCLRAHPDACENFRVPVVPRDEFRFGITPHLCQTYTSDLVQDWERRHEKYFVKKWTCANDVAPKAAL